MGFKIAKNSVIEREYEVNGSPSLDRLGTGGQLHF